MIHDLSIPLYLVSFTTTSETYLISNEGDELAVLLKRLSRSRADLRINNIKELNSGKFRTLNKVDVDRIFCGNEENLNSLVKINYIKI